MFCMISPPAAPRMVDRKSVALKPRIVAVSRQKKRSKTSDYHHLSSPLIVVTGPPLRCLNYITAEPPSIYISISRYVMMKCIGVWQILCRPRKPCIGQWDNIFATLEWVYTWVTFSFSITCEWHYQLQLSLGIETLCFMFSVHDKRSVAVDSFDQALSRIK